MAADDEVFGRSSRFIFHWFLHEQREEVASMSDLLSIVERASESNILLAEDYLARNVVGDQGAPEAGAPQAAGGTL
jgi:bacterioferritin B